MFTLTLPRYQMKLRFGIALCSVIAKSGKKGWGKMDGCFENQISADWNVREKGKKHIKYLNLVNFSLKLVL